MSFTVHVMSDRETWVKHTATAIIWALRDAIDVHGDAYWVLSGGSTPQAVYEYIGTYFRDRVRWSQVHLFWGDERYVAYDDPRSNYGMARDTLLRHLPVPTENVHPMPTHLHDPDLAAQAYETTLRGFFKGEYPSFDLILLGVGTDGHTASLFPGSPALEEKERWVVCATGPDVTRLTLTFPAINHATRVFVLAVGRSKAAVVRQALVGDTPVSACPVRGVAPVEGELHWWLDREAAAEVCLLE